MTLPDDTNGYLRELRDLRSRPAPAGLPPAFALAVLAAAVGIAGLAWWLLT